MSKDELNLYDISRQDYEVVEATLIEKPELRLKKDGVRIKKVTNS